MLQEYSLAKFSDNVKHKLLLVKSFLWHFRNCCVSGSNHIVQVENKNGNKIVLYISLFLFKLGSVKNRHPVGEVREPLLFHLAHTCAHEYTGCPRRNVPDFGSVFLMLKYTDITQNTYVQS